MSGKNWDVWLGDSAQLLEKVETGSVDLVLTSCPFDNLRAGVVGYQSDFDFDKISSELWRVTKPGGVVVWNVNDAIVKGDRTCTSFSQALAFKALGFKLWEVVIYAKTSLPFSASNRYLAAYELCFVFFRPQGKADTAPAHLTMLKDRQNSTGGRVEKGVRREATGTRTNIWTYGQGHHKTTMDDLTLSNGDRFSAPMPDRLAEDMVFSFSYPGDLVLDPFSGAGGSLAASIVSVRPTAS